MSAIVELVIGRRITLARRRASTTNSRIPHNFLSKNGWIIMPFYVLLAHFEGNFLYRNFLNSCFENIPNFYRRFCRKLLSMRCDSLLNKDEIYDTPRLENIIEIDFGTFSTSTVQKTYGNMLWSYFLRGKPYSSPFHQVLCGKFDFWQPFESTHCQE